MMFVINPELAINSSLSGILLWGQVVLPALLPFFFITKILIELDTMPRLTRVLDRLTSALFHCPSISSYVFAMSIISGYPLGAKLTSEYYKKGIITSGEAERMTAFCSTSGPMFIVGSVGIGMFISHTVGIILIVSHIFGAIINGLVFRNLHFIGTSNTNTITLSNNKDILSDSMYNSILSCLMVGGYICVSIVLISFINHYHLLSLIPYITSKIGLNNSLVEYTVNGLLEVTQGCKSISSLTLAPTIIVPIASFLISFGGLSVHLQSLSFIRSCGVKYRTFLLQKLVHGTISCVIAILLCLIVY